jgi:proline dehydrogenase
MLSFDNTEIAFKYKTSSGLNRARLLFRIIGNPKLVFFGKKLIYLAMNLHLPVSWAIKPTLYRHFVGGESIEECKPTIALLVTYNVRSILDYSVEGGKDEHTMKGTLEETLRTIDNAASDPSVIFAVFKPTAFATAEALTEASEGKLLSEKDQKALELFTRYVEILCERAFEKNVPLMIDAEDSWYQSFVDEVITRMMEKYNRNRAIVYNTLQMYRTDRYEFLKTAIRNAEEAGYILGIKFVRGAYMEKERKRAAGLGYPSPIHEDKAATDTAFNDAIEYAIGHIDNMEIFCGSHNEISNLRLTRIMADHGIAKNDRRIWFSQLYGMSDHISFNLADSGYNVAKYIPYGPVKNILPYLIRRAEENTSITGQSGRELSLITKEIQRRKSG